MQGSGRPGERFEVRALGVEILTSQMTFDGWNLIISEAGDDIRTIVSFRGRAGGLLGFNGLVCGRRFSLLILFFGDWLPR